MGEPQFAWLLDGLNQAFLKLMFPRRSINKDFQIVFLQQKTARNSMYFEISRH